jgi:AraC-like DNA-binding protein
MRHLATAPAADRGWIAALRDPVLAPALSLLHGAPGRRWTVASLASASASSRSLLGERFRRVPGSSPIRYLTEWRMHLAEELLPPPRPASGPSPAGSATTSEEAFSRAFKRAHLQAPTAWRSEHATRPRPRGPAPGHRG